MTFLGPETGRLVMHGRLEPLAMTLPLEPPPQKVWWAWRMGKVLRARRVGRARRVRGELDERTH